MRTPIRSDDHDVERVTAILNDILCNEICQSNVCDKTRVEIDVLTFVAKDALSAMVEPTTETGESSSSVTDYGTNMKAVVLMNEALKKRGIS